MNTDQIIFESQCLVWDCRRVEIHCKHVVVGYFLLLIYNVRTQGEILFALNIINSCAFLENWVISILKIKISVLFPSFSLAVRKWKKQFIISNNNCIKYLRTFIFSIKYSIHFSILFLLPYFSLLHLASTNFKWFSLLLFIFM